MKITKRFLMNEDDAHNPYNINKDNLDDFILQGNEDELGSIARMSDREKLRDLGLTSDELVIRIAQVLGKNNSSNIKLFELMTGSDSGLSNPTHILKTLIDDQVTAVFAFLLMRNHDNLKHMKVDKDSIDTIMIWSTNDYTKSFTTKDKKFTCSCYMRMRNLLVKGNYITQSEYDQIDSNFSYSMGSTTRELYNNLIKSGTITYKA